MIGAGRFRNGIWSAARTIALVASTAPISPLALADTLQGVVQETLETNPELGAIKFNRHAIDHELTAARGLVLPSSDVRADGGRRHSLDTTAAGNEGDFGYRGTWNPLQAMVAGVRGTFMRFSVDALQRFLLPANARIDIVK
mgnify:CR=1 FL=1